MKLADLHEEFNAAKAAGEEPVIIASSLQPLEQLARDEGVSFATHHADGDVVQAFIDNMPIVIEPVVRAGSVRIGTLASTKR